MTHPNNRSVAGVGLAFALFVAAGGLGARVASAQPFNIDTTNRETVRVFYNAIYLTAGGPVELGWTGNIAACNPGTIAQSVLDRTLLRVHYFRAMAGVPGITFTPENNALAQAGAFVNSANRSFSHSPPPNWTCYTEQGGRGARDLLLGKGNLPPLGPKTIDHWVGETGRGNENVFHRISALSPNRLVMGYGEVPFTEDPQERFPSFAAMYFGTDAPQPPAPRDGFVAWPPKGFVPYQLAYKRWSFTARDADFSGSTVVLTRNGTTLPTTIEYRDPGSFGERTLVWSRMDQTGDLPPAPAADEVYTVTIGNVLVGGVARTFTYTVTLFDPSVPGADYQPAVITGPDQPPLNQNTTYNFTAVAKATGYQWRSSKLTPLNLTDGAENGLANFAPGVEISFNPVVMNIKASGNASFHFPRTLNKEPGTLTFKRVLLANANSQLTFKSRFETIPLQVARVEVSTDGGLGWATAFNHIGTEASEGAFTDKVVPLGAFAGLQVLIRFNLQYVGGNGQLTSTDSMGWFIDEVTFVNLHEATTPLISNLPAGSVFVFNPTEQSEFALDVRPQFFSGPYVGEFGPVKRVSTISTVATAPVIATQPQGQTVVPGANVTFNVAAQGTAPLTYGWKRDGAPVTDGPGIQGANTASLTLQNLQAAQAGSYTVAISNMVGGTISTPAVLVVNAPPSLATALNTPNLTWTTAGSANWYIQTSNTHDNVSAVQSGRIADSQESRMETTLNGPATVAFWWKVDSELEYDFLRVELDGTQQSRITGAVNWEQKIIAVPAGTHTLRWVYAKDGSESRGADAGWVDQVETRQAQPPPSLADALDTTNITWAAIGDRPWLAQTTVTHDGTDAVQSGPIADGQASRLEATILGPANLSFWWKVDSEGSFDYLTFELDGVQPAAVSPISGNVDWEQKTVPIPAGTHVIRWSYTKDGSAASGADTAYVDQMVLTKLTPGEAGEPGPTLEYTASGAKLRITWPEVAINFKLQVATSLAGRDWADVPENDISKEEGEFVVIVNTSVGTQFYRLVEIQ